MNLLFKIPHITFLFVLVCFVLGTDVSLASVRFLSFSTHARLIFSPEIKVPVRTKWKKKGFEIFFPSLLPEDFGAQLSAVDKKKGILLFKDKRIRKVRVKVSSEGVAFLGTWKFPKGKKAFAYPKMEVFDFWKKKPLQYVVDFWWKSGPTRIEVQERKKKQARLKALQEAEKIAKEKLERHLAALKRQKQVTTLADICEKPLSEKTDLFLKFKPVLEPFSFQKWFSFHLPDGGYHYVIPESISEEARFERLAIHLYQKGLFALVVRVIEFIAKDFPQKAKRPSLLFLKANAFWRLEQKKLARPLMEKILLFYPKSTASLYAARFLAFLFLKNKNAIGALEKFLFLLKNFPKNKHAWAYHLGAAESLAQMGQVERAIGELSKVVQLAPEKNVRAFSLYRMGDDYLQKHLYAQALAAYYKASKYYPKFINKSPFVLLNRAEALYWLNKYDRAEKELISFMKIHAAYPQGWRASFRLAEIFGRKKGKKARHQFRKWLYETINRYPYSTGAMLARLRLLPCGDHGGFNLQGMRTFFEKQVLPYRSSEVHQNAFREFSSLNYIRALVSMGADLNAITEASKKLKSNPTSHTRTYLEEAFVVSLRKKVLSFLKEKKSYQALALFEKYKWGLSEKVHPLLVDFLLPLSMQAAKSGLSLLGKDILRIYFKIQGKLPPSLVLNNKEKSLFMSLSLNEKMKISEESYIWAYLMWKTEEHLEEKKWIQVLKRIDDISPFSFQREVLLAKMYQKKKQYQKALKHVISAEFLIPQKGKISHFEIMFWQVILYEKLKQYVLARSLLEKLIDQIVKKPSLLKNTGKLGLFIDADYLQYKFLTLVEKTPRWAHSKIDWENIFKLYKNNNSYVKYKYMSWIQEKFGKNKEFFSKLKKLSKMSQKDFWSHLAKERVSWEEFRSLLEKEK